MFRAEAGSDKEKVDQYIRALRKEIGEEEFHKFITFVVTDLEMRTDELSVVIYKMLAERTITKAKESSGN